LYIYDLIEKRNIYVNRQFGEQLGYSSLEIVSMGGDLFPSIWHPDEVDGITENRKRFQDATDTDIVELEFRMRHQEGEWRWFRSRETVFARTPDGLPNQILGSAEDITDRKRMETGTGGDGTAIPRHL
jgi:PAS domain S-box-containing protein